MKPTRRTKVGQINRIIIAVVLCILVTEIRQPTPNQKDSAHEHGTMSTTWVGNVSVCKGVVEKACVEITYKSLLQDRVHSLQSETIRQQRWHRGTCRKCMSVLRI
jgi:hypothetical protein